jgi:hypothetical protein
MVEVSFESMGYVGAYGVLADADKLYEISREPSEKPGKMNWKAHCSTVAPVAAAHASVSMMVAVSLVVQTIFAYLKGREASVALLVDDAVIEGGKACSYGRVFVNSESSLSDLSDTLDRAAARESGRASLVALARQQDANIRFELSGV